MNTGTAETTRTDRDIVAQREHAARLAAAAADPLSPAPLRDRAASQAAQAQAIIEHHDRGRGTAAPGQETTT